MAGNGTRWPWWAVLGLTHSLAVTPQPYHPVAVRLEVKNTRRTLVLSKVKCVTRQPGGAENNPCLHSADSWLPRPPLPGRSQESICGRGGKGQGKALGHPKPLRGGGPQGSLPPRLPRHVPKARRGHRSAACVLCGPSPALPSPNWLQAEADPFLSVPWLPTPSPFFLALCTQQALSRCTHTAGAADA